MDDSSTRSDSFDGTNFATELRSLSFNRKLGTEPTSQVTKPGWQVFSSSL